MENQKLLDLDKVLEENLFLGDQQKVFSIDRRSYLKAKLVKHLKVDDFYFVSSSSINPGVFKSRKSGKLRPLYKD